MKKNILVLGIILVTSYLVIGCSTTKHSPSSVEPTQVPIKTSSPVPTKLPTLTPTTAPTNTPKAVATKEISDKDIHLNLASGLSIDAYALVQPPHVEPLWFSPISDYSQSEIIATHEKDRKLLFPHKRDETGDIMMTQFDTHVLKTRNIYFTYPTPQPGSLGTITIEVLLDDKVVYTAEGGKEIGRASCRERV